MVNRKLFRPPLTDMKEPYAGASARTAPPQQTAPREEEAGSARADLRGKFLLREADAVAHARGRGAE